MSRHLFSWQFFTLMLGTLALPLTASAHIPPGGFIIGKMAEKRAALALNDLDVTLQSQYPALSDSELDERLYLKRGGKLRWVRQESGGEAFIVVRDGKRTEVSATGSVNAETDSFEPLVDLLMPRAQSVEAARTEFLTLCQKLGVDLNVSTLGRLGTRVAYVLGAKPNETEKAQIWVDKDTFAPARVIYKDTYAGKAGFWDIQFREFGARESGEAMPRVIERYFDGKLISHSEIEKVTNNPRLAEGLFVAPAVKTKL